MVDKASNTGGAKDTPKVNRSMILLGWQMRVPSYKTDPTSKKRVRGDYDNVKGNARIWWSEKIFDYFGITPLDIPIENTIDNTQDFWTQGNNQTAKYYQDLTSGATTTSVTRKGANTLQTEVGNSRSRTGLSVQVPLLESKKPNGDYRRVSLLLPKFFNLVMVTQALVQIFSAASKTDRKPPYFWTKAGTMYSLPYVSKIINAKAVIAPADCGSWVLTQPQTDTNEDDDNIPENTDVVGGGGGAGKASDNK